MPARLPDAGAGRADPQTLGTNTSSPWFEITKGLSAVHLLTTRFSLGQSHLSALVSSRLALFQAICLPSVAAQTKQHFRWIIIVDKREMQQQLSELVRPLRNAVVYKAGPKYSQAVYEES